MVARKNQLDRLSQGLVCVRESMRIFVQTLDSRHLCLEVSPVDDVGCVKAAVEARAGIPASVQRLICGGRDLRDGRLLSDYSMEEGSTLRMALRISGGIDFQHREGSKFGGGGVMSGAQEGVDRRERLRKLAQETVDLNKDPYFMKNHLGKYECKLCLTLHNNEGNYLAHTQGKRHQQNLARRAAMEAKSALIKPQPMLTLQTRNVIKIGRPGYKVTKARDLTTHQRSLLFEVDYPETDDGVQPRHRFMSAFEQRVEAPDKQYQYLLFACDPYETIGFKVPNLKIDKQEGRFFTNWDKETKKFTLQLYFEEDAAGAAAPPPTN